MDIMDTRSIEIFFWKMVCALHEIFFLVSDKKTIIPLNSNGCSLTMPNTSAKVWGVMWL